MVSEIDFNGPGQSGLLAGMAGGMWPISTVRIEPNISCRGQGTKLRKLKYLVDDGTVLKGIVDKYKTEISTSRSIKIYDNLEGKLIA